MHVSRLQPFKLSLVVHLTLTILPTPQSLPYGGHVIPTGRVVNTTLLGCYASPCFLH